MQTKTIDEEAETEGLGIVEGRGINGDADIAHQNAEEEHKGYAKRDAADTNLAESKTAAYYKRDDHHCLNRRVSEEK